MVLVLCVNYLNDRDAVGFARELLAREAPDGFRLILVDNSERPTLRQSLAEACVAGRNLTTLTVGKNLGYFGGAAWALEHYMKTNALPEWVVVCNSDLRFLTRNFLTCLEDFSRSHDYAVVAPSILSRLSRGDQNPFMAVRPSNLRMRFNKMVFSAYPVSVVYSLLSHLRTTCRAALRAAAPEPPVEVGSTAAPMPIYAGHGACLAFRRTYFEAGGTLYHGAFLFCEEIFVAETLRRLGLSLAYDPRLKVVHEEHKTTGYWPTRLMMSYMKQASAYCADTFF